jgi:hypothetical protein
MQNSTELFSNCSQSYTEPRFVSVAITSATAASVSLLASIVSLFIIVLFKKWQSFGQRLITYLFISVALLSVATLLRRVDFDEDFTVTDERFCTFSGFMVQITVWYLLNSIVAITMYLFLGLVCNNFTKKYEWLYILFIFVFPFIFGWIPFIHNTFGRSGVWCWIKLVDYTTCERLIFGQVLQLVMYYVPILIILPSIILVYLGIFCKLSRNRNRWGGISENTYKHTNKIITSETAHLMVYPLLFFILNLFVLSVRIQLWIEPQLVLLPLLYTSVVSGNLVGATFTLAFLLSKDTRSRIKWTHLQAAFKNYNSKKGISEYTTDVVTEGEVVEADPPEYKVVYRKLIDE